MVSMSIVKSVKDELPKDGAIVYCDNGGFSSDRAIFKNGDFIGGGEYPSPEYVMNYVENWFYLDLYEQYHEKIGCACYFVDFETARNIIT